MRQHQAKLYYFGEHAVVYGEPALVIAVDKRAFVEALPLSGNKVRIFSRDYQSQVEFRLDEKHVSIGNLRPIWTITSKLKEYGLDRGFELRI
ncbi:MAG: hypothetical protein KIH01_02390, partial [Candidatus Freyarchaeota archaeon]|nr:hypothetical protein [Candidatus Jordarchaeia archaeon]